MDPFAKTMAEAKENMPQRLRRKFGLLLVAFLLSLPLGSASGTIFVDNFSNRINSTHWTVTKNQSLYSYDDSNGDVRFSRPSGGSGGFQSIRLNFLHDLSGDFDVSVRFRDASIQRINGTPGNQIELQAIFGGQYFATVRGDEVGDGNNVHVYRDPPGTSYGIQSTTATSGLLRITRTGTTVRGFFNSTQLYSANINGSAVGELRLALQNNGTTDATAVTFDDFSVTADEIEGVPEPQSWMILAAGLAFFAGGWHRSRRAKSSDGVLRG